MTTEIRYSEQFTGQDLEDVRHVAEWITLDTASRLTDGLELDTIGTLVEVAGLHCHLMDSGYPTRPWLELDGLQLALLRRAAEYLIESWDEDGFKHTPVARPFYAERVETCQRVLAAVDRIAGTDAE